MKKLTLLLLLSSLLFAQKYPVNSKKFLLEYDSKSGVLKNSTELKVVYAFDYWSVVGQPEKGHDSLFANILNPDEGRKFDAVMVKKNKKWQAEIDIPADVKLLSYYVTDGKNFDYNDERTYIKYICDEKGKPVKGARFRNIDFMIMAGKTKADIIKEIAAEIKDHPDHFLAYFVYWKYRLEAAENYADMGTIKDEFNKQFAGLKAKQNNDVDLLDVLGTESRVNDEFISKFYKTFQVGRDETQKKIIALCNTVPEEKRSSAVNRIYNAFKRNLDSELFAQSAAGKKAPDFTFTDLNGQKIKLSEQKDKYVLLDFWGTWCGPCVGEIPNLVRAYNAYKDKGFQIISITSDGLMKTKTPEQLKSYTEQKAMNWIHCYDSKELGVIDLYKINKFPTLYLVDKSGNIIKKDEELRGERLISTLEAVLGK